MTCPECRGEFAPNAVGRPRKFCSTKCKQRVGNRRQNRRRMPAPIQSERVCLHRTCGLAFQPKRRDQVYCSPRCAKNEGQLRRYYGAPLRAAALFDRSCVECGKAFIAKKDNAKWCSPLCRIRTCRRDESRRRGPGGADDSLYVDREIFERDGWRCHLCRKPVRRDVPRTHPDGATIDHLVPRSIGGADTPANVATAHWRCNLSKRARPMGEQLALI